MNALVPILVAALAVAAAVAALVALVPPRVAAAVRALLADRLDAVERGQERLERTLREELGRGRAEAAQGTQRLREEVRASLGESLGRMGEATERRLDALRATVEQRLKVLQEDNGARLEQMRATVDEKLQGTLEKRLGESFRLVSERLEAVQRGLGEMQTLANGVGDLKRVLANVKVRGTFGEVQLEALLEQLLAPEQLAKNVATRPGSGERVEFAIRLPGHDGARTEVLLPIDAKFPIEDYQRLVDASERGDAARVEEASRALEVRIRGCARDIHDKYIAPPATTDFALLYLPTEGLYAEVVRRPGLTEALQRDLKVVVAGPTTLAALLNSLQMGFRTLAIQKRSSEVWQVLSAVKTEFGKFGQVIEKVDKKLQEASTTLGTVATRSRAIQRQLRDVEALPAAEAAVHLPALDAAVEPVEDDVPA
ncbi:DNA recombination protein RmuC [Anaeromyxobacter dehalogenans]|uniref:DNA recombination protein RmuC n=1 Tax=Anaeromyxobacter dehalogenans (strain 2CP-C) TaxID=290397 RepID=Q2IGH9_ANADE|nr:DNA recombination protein RmuC [Anaeromyxobacter dehalogenans]ABC83688.1 protein of unknown function DUF195 [Anaeromyxobacter dehalogenans 2CP-C]